MLITWSKRDFSTVAVQFILVALKKLFFLSQELTIDFCRAAINFNSSQHLLSAHASTTVHTCRSSFSRKYTIKIVWGLVCGLVVGQVSFSAM